MAQDQAEAPSPVAGQKRGPGRARKDSLPAVKKQRTSISEATPVDAPSKPILLDSPAPVPVPRPTKLPSRIHDTRPLPSLPHPQAPTLPDSDYQSIASSGVLAASLDRSRRAWTHDGLFERYWQKPESGKNARPLPPNNPDPKTMKPRGKCRLRIEPHIFEVDVWIVVEEKPRPPAPKPYNVQQAAPASQSAYGQPYRAPTTQPYAPHQTAHQATAYQSSNTLPPIISRQSHGPSAASESQAPATTSDRKLPAIGTQPAQAAAKNGPDPVISMLATRASSNAELKALMKEVATGKATQEQLKIFQRHIDELTAVIAQRKGAEEAEAARVAVKDEREKRERESQQQHNGPAVVVVDSRPALFHATPAPQQQQYPATPAPAPAVVFAFTTPGSTEDRFLFPRHSVLEPLSAQHCLASFILTRHGLNAPHSHSAPQDAETEPEYFQPVTLMIEVAYGREAILHDVTRHVASPDQARKHMTETMARCKRDLAQERYLALRLPVKGSKEAEGSEEVSVSSSAHASQVASRAGTPVPVAQPRAGAKKGGLAGGVKKKRESVAGGKGTGDEAAKGGGGKRVSLDALSAAPAQAQTRATASDTQSAQTAGASGGGAPPADGEPETTESGRPKRSTRKSVRISES